MAAPETSQQCDPIRTAGQDEAIRAGASNLASGDFEALADAHLRRKRGQATKAEIAYLDATPEWQLKAALNYHRDVVIPDRRRIADDLRRHGRRAHAFYRDVRPHDYDAVIATSTVPEVRHRLGREHRPRAARRTSSSSTTSSSDPGDQAGDGEPPAGCDHCGPREICWSTAARAWLCLDCAEPFLQIGVGTWAHEENVADGEIGGGVAS